MALARSDLPGLSPFAARARTGEVSDRRESAVGESPAVASRSLVAPAADPVPVEPVGVARGVVLLPEPPAGAVAGADRRFAAVSADLDGCAWSASVHVRVAVHGRGLVGVRIGIGIGICVRVGVGVRICVRVGVCIGIGIRAGIGVRTRIGVAATRAAADDYWAADERWDLRAGRDRTCWYRAGGLGGVRIREIEACGVANAAGIAPASGEVERPGVNAAGELGASAVTGRGRRAAAAVRAEIWHGPAGIAGLALGFGGRGREPAREVNACLLALVRCDVPGHA